jgi:MFS transporter, DHA1 family, tetracycline resistance protein
MRKRPAATVFILFTVLIDTIGVGLIIPVLPKLIEEFVGGGPSEASAELGWLFAAYALMLFLCAPALGSLSDRFGRRPIILVALAGMAFDYVLTAMAPSLWLLFLGRLVAGACGSNFTTATAYIADVSEPEKRAQAFGLIGAAFGVGFILGPALGGLLGQFGPRVPFWVAAGLTALNFVYGLFVLPESLPASERRPFSLSAANPFRAVLRLRRFPAVVGLAAGFFFMQIGTQMLQSIWVLFTEYRFAWTERDVGLSLAVVGLIFGVVQAGLTRVVIPKIGERGAIFTGTFLCMGGLLWFAFATQGWMMYAALLPYAMIGIAGPAMQAIMSRQVQPSEQGELQGTLTALMSLTAIIGPLVAAYAFGWFTRPGAALVLPGAPFLGAVALLLLGLLFALSGLRAAPAATVEPAPI